MVSQSCMPGPDTSKGSRQSRSTNPLGRHFLMKPSTGCRTRLRAEPCHEQSSLSCAEVEKLAALMARKPLLGMWRAVPQARWSARRSRTAEAPPRLWRHQRPDCLRCRAPASGNRSPVMPRNKGMSFRVNLGRFTLLVWWELWPAALSDAISSRSPASFSADSAKTYHTAWLNMWTYYNMRNVIRLCSIA